MSPAPLPDELEASWPRVVRIWLAYIWRNALCVLAGILLIRALSASVPDSQASRWMLLLLSVLVAVAASLVPVKLILNRSFGRVRLSLRAERREA